MTIGDNAEPLAEWELKEVRRWAELAPSVVSAPTVAATYLRLLDTIAARAAEIARLRAADAECSAMLATHLEYMDALTANAACAFCSPRIGAPGLEPLREHMRTCSKHPLAAAETIVARQYEEIARLRSLEASGHLLVDIHGDRAKAAEDRVAKLDAALRFVLENVAVGPEVRKRLTAALEAK